MFMYITRVSHIQLDTKGNLDNLKFLEHLISINSGLSNFIFMDKQSDLWPTVLALGCLQDNMEAIKGQPINNL